MSPFPTVTQCSVTCGQGKATRQVICVNYSDQLVDRSECDPDDLPATEQECSMSPCHPNSHDYGRPISPFLYPDHRLKPHPGGSPNRNRAHIPGGNQWRIGPWGAVSALILLFLGFVGFCFFPKLIRIFLKSAQREKRERGTFLPTVCSLLTQASVLEVLRHHLSASHTSYLQGSLGRKLTASFSMRQRLASASWLSPGAFTAVQGCCQSTAEPAPLTANSMQRFIMEVSKGN